MSIAELTLGGLIDLFFNGTVQVVLQLPRHDEKHLKNGFKTCNILLHTYDLILSTFLI